MGDLSTNFWKKEFMCHCGCGVYKANARLLALLEDIRAHFGRPVKITSGYRCEAHNKAIKGAKDSQHTKGTAADIQVQDTEPMVVYQYCLKILDHAGGCGVYKSWVHIDVRPGPEARWDER